MKKFTKTLLACSLTMAMLAGCGNTAEEPAPADSAAPAASESADAASDIAYPEKPIQIVVPVKAGGDTDYNARLIAQYLEKYIGQTVVVTNVEGGGTVTGMQQVLDAPADGYSVVVNGTDIFVPKMLGNTEIDMDSFKTAGIALLDNTTVLAVNKDSGWATLDDVVKASQANPGTIEYGMKIGAANNVCGIAMEKEWGTKFKNVDVGNNAAKVTALLAGQTDIINVNYSVAKDYFESGQFIPVALLGTEKNPALDVPLASEQGYTDLDFGKFFWLGMHPETPDEIVEKFGAALEQVCADPEFISAMESNYLTVQYMPSQEAHDYAYEVYNTYMAPYQADFAAQQQ